MATINPLRVQLCGITLARKKGVKKGEAGEFVDHVDVMVRGESAHFHGAMRCHCWYACPPCSWALRTERAKDVQQCVKWWRDQGGVVVLVTLTLAHTFGDNLKSLDDALCAGWQHFREGMPGKRLWAFAGIEHFVRGTDATHGVNGWHPHRHVLLFMRSDDEAHLAAVRDKMAERWIEGLRELVRQKQLRRRCLPSWTQSVNIVPSHNHEYLAKLGLELTSSQTKQSKGGETPWEIARRAVAGDAAAVDLWRAYLRGMKGKQQLTWSRKIRELSGVVKRTDDEIVEGVGNDAPETHVASVPSPLWKEVAPKRGAVCAMLHAAERPDGRLQMARTIALYRWGLSPPDPGEQDDQLVLDLFNEIAPVEPERVRTAA